MGDQHRSTHELMNEVLLRAVDALQAGNAALIAAGAD